MLSLFGFAHYLGQGHPSVAHEASGKAIRTMGGEVVVVVAESAVSVVVVAVVAVAETVVAVVVHSCG